ncbi:MAG: hypothetical protein JWQ71_1047 [Pedosphaera sp.]|nr:hypothetical protein [Pedosphaera sp.]
MKFILNQPIPTILLTGLLLLGANSRAATNYVDLNNLTPSAPYTNWSTAATRIQDAIDAAVAGNLILVNDGVYQTGGRAVFGTMTNRVAVAKPLTLLSVNGPVVTTIMGYQVPVTTNGPAAIRCVYLTNGAVLSGFTLTNGATQSSGDVVHLQCGGGIWCESNTAIISNCVVIGNSSFLSGGGVVRGALNNCLLRGNSASLDGGGSLFSTLTNCILTGNSVKDGGGGGAYGASPSGGTLINCIMTGNSAKYGGGAYQCTLVNCTLTGNSASSNGGGSFGNPFTYIVSLNNSIIYDNTAPTNANFDPTVSMYYCCTTPLPPRGTGSFTNAPQFIDPAVGDFHLQTASPCINSGHNYPSQSATDLDGNPRLRGDTVDPGAYEFQNPTSTISYAWLQQYGLPTDGSADLADSDNDGMNDSQEWRAGTDPTNAASVLKLFTPTLTTPHVILTWSSVTNRSYFVQRTTNLSAASPFSVLKASIPGQSGTTSYTDTNAPGPVYYRVGVQ